MSNPVAKRADLDFDSPAPRMVCPLRSIREPLPLPDSHHSFLDAAGEPTAPQIMPGIAIFPPGAAIGPSLRGTKTKFQGQLPGPGKPAPVPILAHTDFLSETVLYSTSLSRRCAQTDSHCDFRIGYPGIAVRRTFSYENCTSNC